MAADNQSEISFSILEGHCHGNQYLLVASMELSSSESVP